MAKRSTRKRVPAFRSERAEREYWETHDAGDVVDWTTARQAVFPSLKASTETISLRLPTWLLFDLKVLANRRDLPYQSLLKMYLADRVNRETNEGRRPRKVSQPTTRTGRASSVPPKRRAAGG